MTTSHTNGTSDVGILRYTDEPTDEVWYRIDTNGAWMRADDVIPELLHLRAVEQLTREMIQEMRLTPDGLIVQEKRDRSDAHYRLCKLLWPKASRTDEDVSK